MSLCFFVSDLHGRKSRYDSLQQRIIAEQPDAVFMGGDLLPHAMDASWQEGPQQADFITDYLIPLFSRVRKDLGPLYPRVFLILGNDDPFNNENSLLEGQLQGLWEYIHGRRVEWLGYTIMGYACIPPSPFLLKDWERYDVSRFVDPGCISPEDGQRSDELSSREIRHTTIALELDELAGDCEDLSRTILLSHCPPYGCNLDRAALDGKMIDHAPLDVHIGSIAIQRFIEEKQPHLTLHGHVHESRRLTGHWQERIGRTTSFNGANDTPPLALIRFDPADCDAATLELIEPAD